MRKISAAPFVALLLCACPTTPKRPAEPPPSSGEAALLGGDLDRALDLLEKETTGRPQDGRAWRALGEAQLQLAEQAIAKGSSNLFVGSSLADAEESLKRAERLLAGDAKTAALRCRLERLRGKVDESVAFAEEAQKRLPADAGAELRYAVSRAAAEASFQKYVALRGEGAETDELALSFHKTYRALRDCEQARPKEPWAYEKQADLFQWEEASMGVVDTLRRGVENAPGEASLHTRLQDFLAGTGQAAELVPTYEELVRKTPEEPTTIWYLGLAWIRTGDARRSAAEWAAAAAAYGEAKRAFSHSPEKRPDFRDTVRHYLTLADLSTGWCRYRERKLDEAAELWTEALRGNLDLKETPDGLGRSAKEGLGLLGGEYFEGREFGRGRTLFQSLSEIDPRDADWRNNYALFCREAGSEAQRQGKKAEADSLFEESYAAYRQAVELSPGDPRIANDCALILLYHLNRDLDLAESMFRRAVALGEAAEIEGTAPPAQAEDWALAVADAYQNLGVLYFDRKGEPFAARPYFERCLEKSPEPRPPVQWYLNRISEMEESMREWLLLWVPFVGSAAASEPRGAQEAEKTAEQDEVGESLRKAQDLILAGRTNDALDLLDEVEKKRPDLPETNFLFGKAYLLKAENLVAQGQTDNFLTWAFSDAASYLEKASQQKPDHGQAFLLLGRARFSLNEIDKAAEAAREAVRLLPKSAEAFQLQGEVAFARYREARQGSELEASKAEFQAALDSFQRATKLSPTFAPAWERLGDLYAWGGKEEESREAYATALGLAPSEGVGGRILQRAPAAEWEKLFERALAESRKVRPEKDNANALLHWYLGYARFQTKQPEKALESFRKTVELDPKLLSGFYYLGYLQYFHKKEYLPAAESFGRYAAADPEGLAQLVREQEAQGQRLAAVLEFLEGEAYGKGNGATAREIAHVNALLDPEKAARWNNYAFLCRETAKYEESYEAYSKALEIEPENPQLLNDAALILQYHLHRDLDKAKEMYERAIVHAQAILADPKKGTISLDTAKIALRDATNNLAKLKRNPKGETSGG